PLAPPPAPTRSSRPADARRPSLRPLENGFYLRPKRQRIVRLEDLADGAEPLRVLEPEPVRLRGLEDDGNIAWRGIGLEVPTRLRAVDFRHHVVAQTHIRAALGTTFEPFAPPTPPPAIPPPPTPHL